MLGSSLQEGGIERRTIFDAERDTALPGTWVRGEGDPPSDDPEIKDPDDGAGITTIIYRTILAVTQSTITV